MSANLKEYGVPIGSSTMIPMERFKFPDRDISCNECVNGRRGSLKKRVGADMARVAMVCTCVPYIINVEDGNIEVVKYRNRIEKWVGGKRSEEDVQNEALRTKKALEVISTRTDKNGAIMDKKIQAQPITQADMKEMGLTMDDLQAQVAPAIRTNAQIIAAKAAAKRAGKPLTGLKTTPVHEIGKGTPPKAEGNGSSEVSISL